MMIFMLCIDYKTLNPPKNIDDVLNSIMIIKNLFSFRITFDCSILPPDARIRIFLDDRRIPYFFTLRLLDAVDQNFDA